MPLNATHGGECQAKKSGRRTWRAGKRPEAYDFLRGVICTPMAVRRVSKSALLKRASALQRLSLRGRKNDFL